MKRCILVIVLLVMLMTGCGNNILTTENPETRSERIDKSKLNGMLNFECLNDDMQLYYDRATNIVYFWNGEHDNSYYSAANKQWYVYSYTPTPYLGPNAGYLSYDKDTNSFKELGNNKTYKLDGTLQGTKGLVVLDIDMGLYYDEATKIVYLWSNRVNAAFPSAYISKNGNKMRYNEKTTSMEEVKDEQSNIE